MSSGVEAHASEAHAHADAVGAVRAVDEVGGESKVDGVRAEGVVRAGEDRPGQVFSPCRVLLTDRVGRVPDRTDLLPDDARPAERGLVLEPPDADWPGSDRASVFRIVVKAHLRHVDHDPSAGTRGQHEARREPDGGAFAGEPEIDVRIREPHLPRSPSRSASRHREGCRRAEPRRSRPRLPPSPRISLRQWRRRAKASLQRPRRGAMLRRAAARPVPERVRRHVQRRERSCHRSARAAGAAPRVVRLVFSRRESCADRRCVA